jgi:class 3 adenylate cyclase/DNA-binding winged helix-turn-helix (wHTH) protein/predicted ATPase
VRYVFAGCRLDTHLYSLHRAGQQIALRPKVFQVLLYLLDHRDRVVTKQELLEAVWPEQYISDATLADCVRAIRRAVGESRGGQQVIQTRHGHGYRLVAEVLVEAAETPQPEQPDISVPPDTLRSEPAVTSPAPSADVSRQEEPMPVSSYVGATLPQASLAAPALPATLPTNTPPPLAAAERRQITVMSCALVDALGLEGHRDPEDWYDVIQAWQETCSEVIAPLQGHIAPQVGAAVLVYFGYPQAHEDDAHRAVLAGLGFLAACEALRMRLAHLPGPELTVRIGIHTGPVIIGRPGTSLSPEQLATGVTPQIATGIQALAPSNTLLVSDATARLVQGYVVCQEAGQQALQGMAMPVQLWHVLGLTAAQSRLESIGRERLTPLVGREVEMMLLQERWQRVQEGEGQVVLLSGEAGIGKSRLADTLRAQVASAGAVQILLRCSPYHTHSALFPVLVHLQRLARLHPEDAPATKLDKLEQMLRGYRLASAQVVPLFAALMAVPLDQRYPPVQLTPEQQKQQTYDALVAWLLEEAERQSLFVLCEDLHWADPSTLELLGLWITQAPMARALTLLLFRPEFRPPWPVQASCIQLTLPRFTRVQVEQMLAVLANDTPLPADIRTQVIARTDGVPLFVEELVKMLQESRLLQAPTAPRLPLTIPVSLQDALMARLDRLGSAKDLAQLGATWGREFTYTQMQCLTALEDTPFQQHLAQLVAAEILHQRGLPPQASYRFKHALIQETAYQSLVRSTRHAYHGHIAHVLAADFPGTMATQPELLAHHYTEAGLVEQAIPYWQQAGERAIRHSAHVEAVSHFSQALALLKTLPETPTNLRQELDLQLALGPALSAIKGYATAEVEQVYNRAYSLCAEVGDTAPLFPTLWGLLRFSMGQGLFTQARTIAEQLVSQAERTLDLHHRLEAYDALVAVLCFLGECAAAMPYLERAMALIDPNVERTLALRQGLAPGVRCLAVAANTLGFLGFPMQAVQRGQEALALAREVGHPYSMAAAQNWVIYVYRRRREVQEVLALAESLVTLAGAQGFPLYVGLGTCWRGWALTLLGAGEAGLVELRQGMATVLAAGQTLARPLCLVLLAEASGHLGQAQDGLSLLDEALATLESSGRGDLLAEVYHLQGTLFLCQEVPDTVRAEICWQQALTVARRQQARALELQAARSLSHLWQVQGKRVVAQQLLAEVYDWFTEGFETADLREAKALLEALA